MKTARTVNLDIDVAAELDRVAKEAGLSTAEMIRRKLRDALRPGCALLSERSLEMIRTLDAGSGYPITEVIEMALLASVNSGLRLTRTRIQSVEDAAEYLSALAEP